MLNILICNAGSSSLKFKLFQYANESYNCLCEGQFTRINSPNPKFVIKSNGQKVETDLSGEHTMTQLLDILQKELTKMFANLKVHAIGHRVVHGGDIYSQPTLITPEVIQNLKNIVYLSPIHLPHNIAPMEICQTVFKDVPQVACFDTAFHQTIPQAQRTYAIPKELTKDKGILRYGFHGLSYEYLAAQLGQLDPQVASGKVVMCHLGAGASVAALNNLKVVDTSMGLTPLEGLVMGTRCGSIDPGIVLYLMNSGLNYQEITDILYYKSGLLGISGISADFVIISKSEEPTAKQAYELFINSVVKNIFSMVATLQGIDGIVFSGGIGENSYQARSSVLSKLNWLNIAVNEEENRANSTIISSSNSKVKCFVIPTQEELVIAEHVNKVLQSR